MSMEIIKSKIKQYECQLFVNVETTHKNKSRLGGQ